MASHALDLTRRVPADSWLVALGSGVVVAWLFLLVDQPVASSFLLAGGAVAAAGAIVYGARIHGVWHPAPWNLIACAVLLYGASVVTDSLQAGGDPSKALSQPLCFAAYFCALVALFAMVRQYWRGKVSLPAVLDALMCLVSAGSVAFAAFTLPALEGLQTGGWAAVVAGIGPLFDVLFLIAAVGLSFTSASKLPALRLLALAGLAILGSDLAFAAETAGSAVSSRWSDVPLLIAFSFAAAAALHPSVRGFNAVYLTSPPEWGPARLGMLAGAVVLPAFMLVVTQPVSALARGVLAAGAAGVGLTLLVRAVSAVNSQAKVQRDLEHRATHDPLTRLNNREALEREVGSQLSQCGPEQSVSLLYVDMDGFKFVNDSFGHAVGDELLVKCAQRIRRLLGQGLAARVGGDEFAIVVPDDATGSHGEQLAVALTAAFGDPVRLSVGRFDATAAIGVANSARTEGARSVTASGLLREADSAMYEAKSAGRGTWAKYNRHTEQETRQRVEMELELRRAIETRQFKVAYQPVVDLDTRVVVSAEALVRWEHPRLGSVPPQVFLAVADQFGLLGKITEQVMEAATERLAADPDLSVSVNVDANHLTDPGFAGRIGVLLDRAGIAPGRLSIEVTEAAVTGGDIVAESTLTDLADRGVGVVIDDFGTGTGTLAALRQVRPAMLKIDRDFVARLGRPGTDQAIRAAVAVADTYGIPVVAKGVESLGQQRTLAQLGVAYGQGWLFGRPAPAPVEDVTAEQ